MDDEPKWGTVIYIRSLSQYAGAQELHDTGTDIILQQRNQKVLGWTPKHRSPMKRDYLPLDYSLKELCSVMFYRDPGLTIKLGIFLKKKKNRR